jgi:hypothetical protein
VTRCKLTVHLGCTASGEVDPSAPVVTVPEDGPPETGSLLPGEIELFGGERVATFEAERVGDTCD